MVFTRKSNAGCQADCAALEPRIVPAGGEVARSLPLSSPALRAASGGTVLDHCRRDAVNAESAAGWPGGRYLSLRPTPCSSTSLLRDLHKRVHRRPLRRAPRMRFGAVLREGPRPRHVDDRGGARMPGSCAARTSPASHHVIGPLNAACVSELMPGYEADSFGRGLTTARSNRRAAAVLDIVSPRESSAARPA